MKMRAKLAGVAALTVALGAGFYAVTAHSQEGRHGPFGQHGMMLGMEWEWDRA